MSAQDEIVLAIPWPTDMASPLNGHMLRFRDERELMPPWRVELLGNGRRREDGRVVVRGAIRADGPASFELSYLSRDLAVADFAETWPEL